MPYRAVAAEALERWREAQRRLATAVEGSLDREQADIDVELARSRYQAAIDDALRAHAPVPPPFDDAIAESESDQPKTDMDARGVDGQVYGG